jgi:tetratricopeptide (TPR) repeat protein
MRKSGILFTVVFSLSVLSTGWSQTVDQLIRFADQKFEQGLYSLAAREYQRALFFGPKDQVGPLSVSTGDCYFAQGDIPKAESYYGFAINLIRQDSLRAAVILKKASCRLLTHQYTLAIFDLFSLPEGLSPVLQRKKHILLGIAYYGLADFEQSEKEFLAALPGEDAGEMERLAGYFDQKKLNRPNPETAYWLSVFLPGSGQLYAGDVKNGLNSLGLTVGLVFVAFRIATAQSWLDAVLTIAPWWQRYYMGGYNSARHIAEHKRMKNRSEVYKRIYALVMGS